MEEYNVKNEEGNKPEKIDITYLLTDFYHGIRKFWWLVIGLAVIFAVKSYFTVSSSYVANYVASATVSVEFDLAAIPSISKPLLKVLELSDAYFSL